MKMQIRKLFLVKRETRELKVYDFQPGKLNVVIGQGARGKTTIWSIVDYVFAARECGIDRNIVLAVDWVGLEVVTSMGAYVIARELKTEKKAQSSRFFLKHQEADEHDIDGLEINPNADSAAVKGLLDRILGVESLTAQADECGQKISFSIRHLLQIVGQEYSTISSQRHLFQYKAPQAWQALSKYFASILGVDADTLNTLRAKKQADEKALNALKSEYKKALAIAGQWTKALADQLLEAKRLTMLPASTVVPADAEKCLVLAREIVKVAKDRPMFSYNAGILGELATRVANNQESKAKLEFEMEAVRARLEEIEGLERKSTAIFDEAEKVKDRMEIARWMKENWFEYEPGFFRYPYSDGRIADEVRAEIASVMQKLENYERTTLSNDRKTNFRNVYLAEKKKLVDRLEKLAADVGALHKEIAALKGRGAAEKARIEEFESVNNRARELVGNFERTIELVEGLTDTGNLIAQIEQLKLAVESDSAQVDVEKARVQDALNGALVTISDRSLEIARGVGIDSSFDFTQIRFSVDELDFEVLTGDDASYLRDRKSTANHVAFHIGVTAAMEECCAPLEKALLPDFVIYDQPSQGRSGTAGGGNVGEACFLNIARELAKSATTSNSKWQPILIDSWSRDTLAKLEGVDYWLVADLDEGSGLVPVDWMRK